MKRIPRLALLPLLLAWPGAAQSPSTNLQLRLEPRTNAVDLIVDGIAESGAFFLYQLHDLQSLLDSPTVAVQANTPLTNCLRFSIPTQGALPSPASCGRSRAGGGWARELRNTGGTVTILCRTSVNQQPMKEPTV